MFTASSRPSLELRLRGFGVWEFRVLGFGGFKVRVQGLTDVGLGSKRGPEFIVFSLSG